MYLHGLDIFRAAAVQAIDRCRQGVVVQFVGDSKVLVDCLIGRARTEVDGLKRPVAHAHSLLLQLTRCFGWRPPQGRELAQQVCRADNSAADAAAN